MILAYQGTRPELGKDCFVAENATVVGQVTLGNRSSVWFNAVLRGDVEHIEVGAESNLQDGVIVHADPGSQVRIGNRVTVGHAAVLHGCTVEEGALIGIGATVLDGAVIGSQSLIAARSLIPPGKQIPPRSLVMGVPGKVVRSLTQDELQSLAWAADEYVHLARGFLTQQAD
ncbi:gamma carbonic anhydrase family protein [Pseudomonas aeruginosa]|uniref:gamma carbonic anhydrase family protein n=1 Tax=Pseudomonas aeruginosa TaxID=287 RepID=UPI000EB48750|nr:gamma carbonic anhydrase family protein [Pseudomonas aeruginosa]